MSTLSRLESGQRRPTLELLLPLARVYRVPLDDLVGAPPTGDPRLHPRPITRNGMTVVPLSRHSGRVLAWKLVIPAPGGRAGSMSSGQSGGQSGRHGEPTPQSHEGWEWFYVLSGRIRLVLGEHDIVLTRGEVAEFDTRTPHWFGNPGPSAAEVLSLFGPQGERVHVRARSREAADSRQARHSLGAVSSGATPSGSRN